MFLNGASKEFYAHCMMRSEILEELMTFLRRNMKSPSFTQAIDTILEVLNDIESKNINGNAHKIKRIKTIIGYVDSEDKN